MENKIIVPKSYKHSRELFMDGLSQIKAHRPNVQHTALNVCESEDLTIDLFSSEAGTLENLLILSTGLHGIEGFIGSIMMQLFMEEFLPKINPAHTGILLIHCINPTGMHRHYRTNRENVDLNRNFILNFSQMRGSNIDYFKLNRFFNPKFPLKLKGLTKLIYYFQTLKWLVLYGPRRVRNAALMGQYEFPSGMYFGGQKHQPETIFMMGIFREWIPRYQNIIHLDMHSGYGPRSQMTLIQSSKESLTSREARNLFDLPLVVASNSDEFYKMNGEMADFIYELAGEYNNKVYSASFEFGTYGDGILQEAKSLLTTIAANQLLHNNSNFEGFKWVERDYKELYFPSEKTWVMKAIEDGRQGFKGILHTKGLV